MRDLRVGRPVGRNRDPRHCERSGCNKSGKSVSHSFLLGFERPGSPRALSTDWMENRKEGSRP
jgi:hypothetical protein